jgi:hypothetical protein
MVHHDFSLSFPFAFTVLLVQPGSSTLADTGFQQL